MTHPSRISYIIRAKLLEVRVTEPHAKRLELHKIGFNIHFKRIKEDVIVKQIAASDNIKMFQI
jgi:hypothetical protein